MQEIQLQKTMRIRNRKTKQKRRENREKMKESKIKRVITEFSVPKAYYVIKHTEVCNVSDTA